MKQEKQKPMTRAGLEIQVGKILNRAQVTWVDDNVRNERHMISGNHKAPITYEEKKLLVRYFESIKFPMKIVFY